MAVFTVVLALCSSANAQPFEPTFSNLSSRAFATSEDGLHPFDVSFSECEAQDSCGLVIWSENGLETIPHLSGFIIVQNTTTTHYCTRRQVPFNVFFSTSLLFSVYFYVDFGFISIDISELNVSMDLDDDGVVDVQISVFRPHVVFSAMINFFLFILVCIVFFVHFRHLLWPNPNMSTFQEVSVALQRLHPNQDVSVLSYTPRDDDPDSEVVLFCSHRGPDSKDQLVRPLSYFLKRYDVRHFFDQSSDHDGCRRAVDNTHEISRGLARCHMAVVFISDNFLESVYCCREFLTILHREQVEDRSIVFPVYLNPALMKHEVFRSIGTKGSCLMGLGEMNWRTFFLRKLLPDVVSLSSVSNVPGLQAMHDDKSDWELILDEYLSQPGISVPAGLRRDPSK